MISMTQLEKEELIKLLTKLVSFNTVNIPTKNIKSPKDCPEFIVEYLSKKGIEAYILEDNDYYSVYGKIGTGDFHLTLMAHFDVVPVGDGWDTDPFEMVIKEENTAYGRGVIDNKNNIASIMTILPEIAKLDLVDKMTVCFDFSGDEEIGGVHGSGNYLKKFEKMPDAVMNLDGAGNVVISRRRNAMGATLQIPKTMAIAKGKIVEKKFITEQYGRHSAYRHPGADVHCLIKSSVDAWYNSWKVITIDGKFIKGNVVPDDVTIKAIQPEEDGSGEEYTYDVGLTKLLTKLRFLINTQFPTEFSTYGITIGPNILFDKEEYWELGLDIRAMTQQYDQVEKSLRDMCDELYGDNEYTLTFKPGQGMVNTPKDSLIVATALEVSKEFGFPGEVVEMGGASDARYFSREGIPTFDFGPNGGGVHAKNEWLDLNSFYETTKFYLEVVKRMLKKI